MNGPSPSLSLDLFAAVRAAAEGVARLLRHDPSSAVLFWGDPPEVEVVHRRDVPDDVCRALATAGGRTLVEAVRRAGHPLRVPVERMDAAARELRVALRAHGVEELAVFPLLGERGVIGCLVVPLDAAAPAVEDAARWRDACRTLEALQLATGVVALQTLLDDDAGDGETWDGILVTDRWERVILADGLMCELPRWSESDPFGRALHALPGGALLSGLTPPAGEGAWAEHLLPPSEAGGIPVALSVRDLGLEPPEHAGARLVLVRDLRAAAARDGDARLLALGMRVAHAADELDAPAPSPVPGRPPFLAELERWVREGRGLVRRVLQRCLPPEGLERMDLNDILNEVLGRYEDELRAERVRLFRFQRPELPLVAGDRLALLGVFRGLVQSARASLGGRGGSLTVRTWAEGGWVHAVVSDDGVGHTPARSAELFEPLYVPVAEEGPDEALAAVRRQVEELGGRFQVECRPNLWTRLTVMLPESAGAEPARDGPPPAVRVEAAEGGGLEVLVVDDNAALRSVLRRYLERRGHVVTEAADGDDALELVARRAFDRVIVDVRMPGKDGPEFYACLDGVAPALRERTIFMTGGFLEDETERFIEASGRPSIRKPFDLKEMVETVEG